jgi:diguanylate cyclase (GGDEF)-like protein
MPMMNSFSTPLAALLAAMLLQQAFLSLLWFGAAWLRLARRPALHWGATMLLLGCGISLIGLRGELDPWLGRWAANTINLAAFVAAARGAALFTRAPLRDAEHGLVLLAVMAGTALVLQMQADPRWITVQASGAMAWVVLRSTWKAAAALRSEFGPAAWLCVAPLAGFGLIAATRALGAATGSAIGAPLDPQAVGATQPGLMLGYIAMTLLVNAGFCAMVLLRMVGRLHRLSMHDPLTGLPNRRSLLASLAEEQHRMARGGRPFALLSVDVDHFKSVNDTHGHGAGDAALAHIAEVIRSVARVSDRPARIGGEEFVLLLPATDADGARRVAERLLQAMRERPLTYGSVQLRLSVSIGGAMAEAGKQTAEQALATLWQRADAALYRAKSQGRDQLVLSEPA